MIQHSPSDTFFWTLSAAILLACLTVNRCSLGDDEPAVPADPPEFTSEQLEFFEKRIRPVLVQHCYECHSASSKELKGSLALDSRPALLSGGDSGPAAIPGNTSESLLISALKHESFEMPPKGKLPGEVIKDFEKWVEMGLPDPRTEAVAVKRQQGIDLQAGRAFWSFRPLQDVEIPRVNDSDWPLADIDRFVLKRLESQEILPSPSTDPRTLLRRLSFDLTGLPPSPAEQRAFEEVSTQQGIEQVVDRLLDSPGFGERWGRYWLDSARFSESTGGGRSMLYGPAWRYRDYVIDSFNADKPFDQFVIEQLAGDLLSSDDVNVRAAQLTATGFLALGPTNYELQDKLQLEMDVIDEQIETVGRVFLGMTLGCARCHDHKFDPVPTADYYALAGIFKSTHTLTHSNVSNWVTLSLPLDEEMTSRLKEHEQQVFALKEKLEGIRRQEAELSGKLPTLVVDEDQAEFSGNWTDSTHTKKFVGKMYRHANEKGAEAVFRIPVKPGEYDVLVSYSAGANRCRQTTIQLETADGVKEVQIDQTNVPAVDEQYTLLGSYAFGETATVRYVVNENSGVVIVDSVMLRTKKTEQIDSQGAEEINSSLAKLREEISQLVKRIEKVSAAKPAPEKVIAVEEAEKVVNEKICIRGNIKQRGIEVPRGFLSVASWDGQPVIPETASGRLELAHWLVSPKNPLTARVYVNRVWSRLFGQGLVRTVDNFGKPGEVPSHPELLDYLARRFMDEGWSTKRLIRNIVLSRTYQMSSAERPDLKTIDPENRLLARQNRRRLDAEAIYDALLAVSGELDPGLGGNTIRPDTKSEIGYDFEVGRRAVYLPVFRNQLPDLFSVFDFANPNQSMGRRNVSTLSTQSLFLMNSPFIVERARNTASKLAREIPDPLERIELLFEQAVGRPPTSPERELALNYLQAQGRPEDELKQRWVELCQSVFGSIDFRYLD